MSAFKRIYQSDVATLPYTANKQYSTSIVNFSSSLVGVYKGIKDSKTIFNPNTNTKVNGQYCRLIYDYINTKYYHHYESYTASIVESLASNNYDSITSTLATASYTDIKNSSEFVDNFPTIESGSFCLISIPANVLGEGIQPETFLLKDSGSSYNITDDGKGNLTNTVDQTNVGNIFYNEGEAVLIGAGVESLLNTNAQLTFKNRHTIHEKIYKITIKNTEFNGSYNPTLLQSGSFQDLRSFTTSSSFSPYICGVGLYDDRHELLAVAKLGQPLPKPTTINTNILIKFDM